MAPVVALWQATLARASYVWLTSNTVAQIPWTRQLYGYFLSHFRLIGFAGPPVPWRYVPRPVFTSVAEPAGSATSAPRVPSRIIVRDNHPESGGLSRTIFCEALLQHGPLGRVAGQLEGPAVGGAGLVGLA